MRRSVQWACLLAILLSVAGQLWAAPTSVAYLCKYGEAPRRLQSLPVPATSEPLDTLKSWDLFAVDSIARAVRGQARLTDALPLFETLLRNGPYAGAFAEKSATIEPFTALRARRFLDAAARLAAGPNLGLVRELLAEAKLVTLLRQDTTGSARTAGDYLLAHFLTGAEASAARARFLPWLLGTQEQVSDPELAARCLTQVDQGSLGGDVARLLADTYLWDLRLFLLAYPSEEELATVLKLPDDQLTAIYTQKVAAAHLRYFLFGGRETKAVAEAWDSFEADRFLKEHPDFGWVAHAAALAHELQAGTVLRVTGEDTLLLGKSGETLPRTYLVEPAQGATYATASLVWPRSVDKTYEGLRCLQDTTLVRYLSPLSAQPKDSGLSYQLVFTKAGTQRLTFEYRLYGLDLQTVTHPVVVRYPGTEEADPTASNQRFSPRSVVLELTTPPAGFVPVANAGQVPSAGQPQVINGGRKTFEFTDGQHAMEHLVVYEIRAASEDRFPEEVTYCDPNPRGDQAISQRAAEEAETQVTKPLQAYFDLVPSRFRVLGRDCWVGRKGCGQDGQWYYVLCRGTETYYKRSELYPYQKYWDPLIGEQPVYDTSKIKDDTIAYAEAVLQALRAVGPGKAPVTATATPGEKTTAYLGEARQILQEDTDLVARANLIVAAWQQKRLDNEAAAKTMQEDIAAAYDALSARAAALSAPDPTLQRIQEGVTTALSVGVAASGLMHRGILSADPDKVTRGISLLHSFDADRQALRTRVMTFGLELK